jgi:hypothetical protein
MMYTCPACQRSYPDKGRTIKCLCRAGGSHRVVGNAMTCKPGTELKCVLDELGIESKKDCNCKCVQCKMDRWGLHNCELPQNRQWIIEQLQANAAKYSWAEKIYTSAYVVLHPSQWRTALRLNPLSMAESLLDEALRRAKAKSEAT